MTCTEIQYLIDEIGDLDRLPPDAARHVDACRACERFGHELVSLRSLLREPGRLQAPADFDARLARRLRTARETRARRPVLAWLAVPRHGFAATAAAALLVVGGLTVSRVTTQPDTPAPSEIAVSAPAPQATGTGLSAITDPERSSNAGLLGDPAQGASSVRARDVSHVRVSTARRQTSSRRTAPQDTMVLMSDAAGTHMVNVPAVLVGAEQILPTAGAAPSSAGVAF
jgi:hypothetical protein